MSRHGRKKFKDSITSMGKVTIEIFNKKLKDIFSGEEMEFLDGKLNGEECAFLERDNKKDFFQTLQSLNVNDSFLRVYAISGKYIACERPVGTFGSLLLHANKLYKTNKTMRREFTQQAQSLIMNIAKAIDFANEKNVNFKFDIRLEKVYLTRCSHGLTAKLAEQAIIPDEQKMNFNYWRALGTMISNLIKDKEDIDEEIVNLSSTLNTGVIIKSSTDLEFHPAMWDFQMRQNFIMEIVLLVRAGEKDYIDDEYFNDWKSKYQEFPWDEQNNARCFISAIRNVMCHKVNYAGTILDVDDEAVELYFRSKLPLYMVKISFLCKGTMGVESPRFLYSLR